MAASGGAWLLGDALTPLPPERLERALDPDATAAVGLDVVPVDPLSFVSGWDTTPLLEATLDDDRVALLNLGPAPLTVEGPGGSEALTGEEAEPGPRVLAPGVGELWRR